MKRFSLILLIAIILTSFTNDKPIVDCKCKGIPLHGKVKVVTAFPDFKVQTVTAFPDIKVKKVTCFPDDCGEWQFVDAFPDFTIQYVTAFPDFKVQFVEVFHGTP
ncbi:MAG: hypothetical protein H6Q25_1194 [Bacteroidetes bacterium]|nr:hypothetical protein [Bacteroidota bacterium]